MWRRACVHNFFQLSVQSLCTSMAGSDLYCVYRLKKLKIFSDVMLRVELVRICNARWFSVWLVEGVWLHCRTCFEHLLDLTFSKLQMRNTMPCWSRCTVVNCVRTETNFKSQVQVCARVQISSRLLENTISSYPLYTALLWDSRWIGNPTNHSSTTASVSPRTELLERAFFQPHAVQRIQLAEVDWKSDNKGFDWKWCWVACIKSLTTFSVLVWCQNHYCGTD